MNALKSLARSFGKGVPAPRPAEQGYSSTMDVVRDVQDRRAQRKTGRLAYFGARVTAELKEELEGLPADLRKERGKKVTMGAVLEEMRDAFRMLRGKDGVIAEGLEQLAKAQGMTKAQVIEDLIAERVEALRGKSRKRA